MKYQIIQILPTKRDYLDTITPSGMALSELKFNGSQLENNVL